MMVSKQPNPNSRKQKRGSCQRGPGERKAQTIDRKSTEKKWKKVSVGPSVDPLHIKVQQGLFFSAVRMTASHSKTKDLLQCREPGSSYF